jgi:hypothetical protein
MSGKVAATDLFRLQPNKVIYSPNTRYKKY